MESKLMPGFYTQMGSTQAGLTEKDFAVTDREGDFGEGGDVPGGLGGEDDEVAVHAFGDAG